MVPFDKGTYDFLVEPNKVRKVDSLVGQVLDMLIVTSNALDEYLLSSPCYLSLSISTLYINDIYFKNYIFIAKASCVIVIRESYVQFKSISFLMA